MSPARRHDESSAEVSLGVRGLPIPQRSHSPPTDLADPADD
jgi:hypothetical protein